MVTSLNTKPVLDRVYEIVCFQKIYQTVLYNQLKDFSWDGGQADGRVIAHFREETLFGDGIEGRRPKLIRLQLLELPLDLRSTAVDVC